MPAKPIDNERRACDAVVRVLEERHGAARANGRSPEDERVGPPVEYVFDLGEPDLRAGAHCRRSLRRSDSQGRGFRGLRGADRAALDHQMPLPAAIGSLSPSTPQGAQAEAHRRSAGCDRCVGARGGRCNACRVPSVPMRGRGPYGHESNRRGNGRGYRPPSTPGIGWSLPEAAYGRVFCGRFAPPNYRRSESNGCAPH